MTARTWPNAFAFLLFALVLVAGVAVAMRAHGAGGDFVAFRCGADVVVHGGDPYAQSPLYACETRPRLPFVYRAAHGVAIPVPLPGYAIACFIPFALVPFGVALFVWLAVSVAAAVGCAVYLRAFGAPFAHALIVLAALAGLVSIPYGELVPLAVFALCACARALQRERFLSATGFAALAAIEPHLGAPVLVALIVHRATRTYALIVACLLALTHAFVLRADAVTYFTTVLPDHARAELLRSSQFSLSWMLAAWGFSPAFALAAGSLTYLVAAVVGIVLAHRSRRMEMLAFFPAAAALCGGTFVHLAQMLFALPLAIVVTANARRVVLSAARVAIISLALPWQTIAQSPWLLPLVPLLVFGLAFIALAMSARRSLIVALTATIVAALLVFAALHLSPIPQPVPVVSRSSAEFGWARWIAEHDVMRSWSISAMKVPTWAGLWALWIAAARAVSAAMRAREAAQT